MALQGHGPVGLNALWSEPWFLITLADLYLGVVLAMGFVWIQYGAIMGKLGGASCSWWVDTRSRDLVGSPTAYGQGPNEA